MTPWEEVKALVLCDAARMSFPVVLRDEARAEFDEAFDFYEGQRPGLGVAFATRVQEVFHRLGTHPAVMPGGFRGHSQSGRGALPLLHILPSRSGAGPVIAVFIGRDPTIWQGLARVPLDEWNWSPSPVRTASATVPERIAAPCWEVPCLRPARTRPGVASSTSRRCVQLAHALMRHLQREPIAPRPLQHFTPGGIDQPFPRNCMVRLARTFAPDWRCNSNRSACAEC